MYRLPTVKITVTCNVILVFYLLSSPFFFSSFLTIFFEFVKCLITIRKETVIVTKEEIEISLTLADFMLV